MAIPNDTCGDSPPRDQSRATLSCSDTLLAVEISSVKNAVWRGGVALAHIVTGMYVLVRGDIIYIYDVCVQKALKSRCHSIAPVLQYEWL